ncbi:MAG: hypothetical protein RBU37_08175 [Myxococcota bacterium]|jgi:hypothetical protein|nr:hypothetical protein [Myxococcota bacterium]
MQAQGKLSYYCPHCGEKLSLLDGTLIKMAARLHAPTFTLETMVYVPAQLGQSGIVVDPSITLKEGAKFELECCNPVCRHPLATHYNDELAEIRMQDETGRDFRVVFNTVYGKNSTFVIDVQARELVGSFGESSASVFGDTHERERNFFGE